MNTDLYFTPVLSQESFQSLLKQVLPEHLWTADQSNWKVRQTQPRSKAGSSIIPHAKIILWSLYFVSWDYSSISWKKWDAILLKIYGSLSPVVIFTVDFCLAVFPWALCAFLLSRLSLPSGRKYGNSWRSCILCCDSFGYRLIKEMLKTAQEALRILQSYSLELWFCLCL